MTNIHSSDDAIAIQIGELYLDVKKQSEIELKKGLDTIRKTEEEQDRKSKFFVTFLNLIDIFIVSHIINRTKRTGR